MKKAVLLLMLLPFIGFSQTTIAVWNTNANTLQPATAGNQNLVASALTGTGISGPFATYNGAETSGWPSSATINTAQFIQFTIASLSNNTVTVNGINFDYRGNAKRHQVRYSTDNFATSSSFTAVNNGDAAADWNSFNSNNTFTQPVILTGGQKLTVRIYAAGGSNRVINSITAVGNTTTPSQYAGTYHVGAAQSYPFNTVTNAVTAVVNYGISNSVTLLLDDANYSTATGENFPLTVTPVNGASATKTITIKPAPGVNTVISGTNPYSYAGIPALFTFQGADYFTIDGSNAANGTTRNLTIDNKDNSMAGNRAVVWVASNNANGATNITVKNTIIKASNKNQGGKFSIGVYSGNYGIDWENGGTNIAITAATANNSNLTVTNNDFVNVKQGVYVNGTSSLTTNVVVNRNDLGATTTAETVISPATFINVNSFEYSDNLVNNLYRDTNDGDLASAGVYVAGASKNGQILRNNMKDLTKTTTNSQIFGGIVLSSTDFNANILVANNFILNVTGQGNGGGYLNGYGIIADNGGGYKIYHNTVALNTNQPNGGFTAAFYVNTSARNLDVRNNIFANNQTSSATRRAAIIVRNTATNVSSVFTNLDYNDYFSNDRLGYIANAHEVSQVDWAGNGVQGSYEDNPDYKYTLQAWQNVTRKDAHSVNVNPGFASVSDLHIDGNNATNEVLKDKGFALGIERDIDNQLRSTTTPDMGADEFGPITSMPVAGDPTGIYCDNATTWNGTSWSNGEPTASTDVIFSGNYTKNGGTLYACSIFVLNGASVNFMSNSNAIVTHSVSIATTGSLTFESSSNLIQLENDANSGTAIVKRNSSRLKRLDYTMWTAPVLDSRTTGYQSLLSFSPATATSRFYEYSTARNEYHILPAETTKFALGKGYLIRMPNADATPGYNTGNARLVYNGAFAGTPNNGNVKVDLSHDADGYNAVGNPYPSPISVKDFINANLNSIEGTIWIWRKTNDYTVSSYSTVNLTGYVANIARGGGETHNDGNDLIADPYAIDPKGLLNTAQGFIVKSKAANSQIVFKNNMRLRTHSNTFFRTAAPNDDTQEEVQTNRLWLNATTESGEFSQTLIGYNNESTLGYDNGYDGKALINGNLNLYSVINSANDTLNLTIQARGRFAVADRVKLGYKASLAGTYIVSLDHADGIFEEGQTVYLVDNTTGTFHNLSEGSFTFSTEAGQFDERFTVAYATDEQLGTDTPVLAPTQATIVYKEGKQVKVDAPSDINTIAVYDMLGKTLFQKSNIDGTQFATTDINVASQIVIVKITLDNNQVVSKKIMMN